MQADFAKEKDGSGLSFQPVELVNHHLLVVGQTGSGKTTTALSLISQLQQANQTTIILDPTGEYSQLPNSVTYNLGENAYLEAGNFSSEEFQDALQLHLPDFLHEKLEQAIDSLRIQQNLLQQKQPYVKLNVPINRYQEQLGKLGKWARSFPVQLLANQLIEEFVEPYEDQRANYDLLGQQYDRQAINHYWGTLTTIRQRLATPEFRVIFDPEPHPGTFKTELNFVIEMFLNQRSSHRTLVINLAALKDSAASQRVVISLLLKKLLFSRLQHPNDFPVRIVLDEAHRYLPKNEDELADNGIFQVLREGRKLGLSMILTTQSPLDLPARLRSQFADLLLHHMTSPEEVTSLGVAEKIRPVEIAKLSTGEAIALLPNYQPQIIQVNLPSWWQK